MMKKEYTVPEMEIIELDREDTILTSGACNHDWGCSCHGHTGEER